MRRLPFVLPDFTRITWTSDKARDTWGPRLAQISDAWVQIQWLSVAEKVRRCALLRMSAAAFAAHTPRWAERRVSALGLGREASGRWSYASSSAPAVPGQASVVVVGLASLADLNALRDAWTARQDEPLGELLGYPACCRQFFHAIWTKDRHVDTTWPMAVRSLDSGAAGGGGHQGTRIEVAGDSLVNVLWRWAGVRAVPHLPCSFGCEPSARLAGQMLGVGRRAGFRQEMVWLEEILCWPVEWSALHGIAEIKTPILKMSARTDATPVKYEVRRSGTRYPAEGATALMFPYRSPAPLRIVRPAARTMPVAPATGAAVPAWYHQDNGFGSRQAMDEAQASIVELAAATLGGREGRVLDLGCGNGLLLWKIRARSGERPVPYGIDLDSTRIEHARQIHPAFAANFRVGDLAAHEEIWTCADRFDLVLLSVRRLLEIDRDRSERLRALLREKAAHVLVYSYPSAEADAADLSEMAARAGLELRSSTPRLRVALARVLPQP